ncbi:MAG: hypothetical protein LBM41_07805 [Ruminococcus sp.]|jgi:hypothetical protein|nr:hypothetical protein [Ruminococcus sp.]
MNISPDNIERYKQDMMNMYRTSGSGASPQVQPQTARTLPADIAPSNAGTPAYIPDTGYIEVPKFPGIPDTGEISPTPIAPPDVQVPDTGYIEAPKPDIQVPDTGYIEIPKGNEGVGYLRTQVYASNRAIPIEGALVLITEVKPGGRTDLVRMLVTDESGYTDTVPLSVPVYDLDNFPDPNKKPYRDYRLSVYKEGYYIVPEVKIPIFAGVKSLQPIQMVPLRENEERINILPKPFADAIREQNASAETAVAPTAATIPEATSVAPATVEELENPPVGNVG